MPGRAPGSTLARVGSIPAGDDVLDPDEPTYDLPRVAELLGVPVSKVAQQLREGHLVAVRRAGGVVIPQVFFTNSGQVVKSLPGLLTILHDGAIATPRLCAGCLPRSVADHHPRRLA